MPANRHQHLETFSESPQEESAQSVPQRGSDEEGGGSARRLGLGRRLRISRRRRRSDRHQCWPPNVPGGPLPTRSHPNVHKLLELCLIGPELRSVVHKYERRRDRWQEDPTYPVVIASSHDRGLEPTQSREPAGQEREAESGRPEAAHA